MPKFEVTVCAGDCREALRLDTLPDGCPFNERDMVEIEVEIHQSEIDEEASPVPPETVHIEAETRDLRDGIRALLKGDRSIALTLLERAFEADAEVTRVVQEELR